MSDVPQKWRWLPVVAVGLAAAAAGFVGTSAVVPSGALRATDPGEPPRASTDSSPSGSPGQASVWAGRTPAEQFALAGRWGDVRDAQSIRERLDNLHTLPNHFAQTAARATLLLNWLAIDPEAACQWCSQNRRDDFAASLMVWVAADQEAATAYAWTLADDNLAASAFGILSSHLADSDPAAALTLLASLPAKLQGSAYAAIRKLAEADPHALLEEADRMGADLRDKLRSAAAQALAADDPAAALAWWADQPDHSKRTSDVFGRIPAAMWPDAVDLYLATGGDGEAAWRNLAGNVGHSWAREDPTALLALVAERTDLPEKEAERMTSYAVDKMARDEPEAAVTWLLRQENPDAKLAEKIASRWGAKDLEAARDGLAAITDPTAKTAVEEALAAITLKATLSETRPTTAAEFVAHAVEADANNNDLSSGFRNLPSAERDRIVASAAALPAEEANALALKLVRSIEHSHPTGAAELLLLASPQDEKETNQLAQHAARFAALWGNSAPSEAASWASRLAEGPLRTNAATNLVTQWKAYDPAAARTWADALPDPESRAAALAALDKD